MAQGTEILTKVNLFDVMDLATAQAAAEKFRLNRYGLAMIARSDVSLKAPKKTAQEWLDVFGYEMPTLQKISIITNCRSYNYGKKVNKSLAADGNNPNFESEAPNGCEWVVFPVIKRTIRTGELLVTLTFTDKDKSKVERRFLVGDRLANEDEAKFITEHLYQRSYSVKQAEHGLTEQSEQIQVRNYKLKNVLTIGVIEDVKAVWERLTA